MGLNALVTGASAGLGRELVVQLVRDRGMTVLVTARRRERLDELAANLPKGRVVVESGDLADPAFRARLWSRAEQFPGGIDLLVNNAGLGNYAKFSVQDEDAIRRMVEVNLMALIDLTQKASRHMTTRGSGQIIEISSVLGFIGLPYSAVYVATKHAVNGLVKSLCNELRGTGVRVWAACPGRTESEFSQVALGHPGAADPVARGAATETVVRAIVRELDGRKTFLFPTWDAWAAAALAHWLPGPFDWTMRHWIGPRFAAEIAHARKTPG